MRKEIILRKKNYLLSVLCPELSFSSSLDGFNDLRFELVLKNLGCVIQPGETLISEIQLVFLSFLLSFCGSAVTPLVAKKGFASPVNPMPKPAVKT